MKEKTPDGTTIIRRASSKFYTEETLDKRFRRILGRQKFHGLEFFLRQMDASDDGIILLTLQVRKIEEILKKLNWKLKLKKSKSDFDFQKLPHAKAWSGAAKISGITGTQEPIMFDLKSNFFTTKLGVQYLNEQLSAFKELLLNGDS